jgi:hypothetical protein
VSGAAGGGGGVTFVVSFFVVSLVLALFDDPQPAAIEPIIAAISAKFKICFFIEFIYLIIYQYKP